MKLQDVGTREQRKACPQDASEASRRSSPLSVIGLHLARCPDHPLGDDRFGYSIVAPLDDDNRLNATLWKQWRDHCTVHRFEPDRPDLHGHLLHRHGGSGGATWTLSFPSGAQTIHEFGVHLQDHRFIPGAYIAICQRDGEVRPFRIETVHKVVF